MDGEFLMRSIWLTCLFAEVVLLLQARAWLTRVEGSDRSQRPAWLLCAVGAATLSALVLGGEAALGDRLDALPGHRRHLFTWGLWNLVATLIVAVEQIILVYLVRLDGLLRGDDHAPPMVLRVMGALLVGGSFLLYGIYLAATVRLVDRHGLGEDEIGNLSAFYCRIACALCVILEWLLAIFAVRAWRRLVRQG